MRRTKMETEMVYGRKGCVTFRYRKEKESWFLEIWHDYPGKKYNVIYKSNWFFSKEEVLAKVDEIEKLQAWHNEDARKRREAQKEEK
jgi:hypothetical protein